MTERAGSPPSATTLRPELTAARRIIVKVGSSSLTTAEGGIDPERVRELVDSLAGVRERGADLVLVSSGAIANRSRSSITRSAR